MPGRGVRHLHGVELQEGFAKRYSAQQELPEIKDKGLIVDQ